VLELNRALEHLGVRIAPGKKKQTTYYGRLIDFAWHSSAAKGGTQFSPIYYAIEQQAKRDPHAETELRTIWRRLVYLEILGTELSSLDEIYEFKKIRTLKDRAACLIEVFASKAAEVALLMAAYWWRQKGTGPELRFENLSEVLSKTHKVFSSINSALEGFLLVALRNRVVHAAGFKLNIVDGHPEVVITLGKDDKPSKFGVLLDYVRTDVATGTYGTKVGIEKRDKAVYHLFKDGRFPYVTFVLRRSKSGTFPAHDAEFRYRLSPQELVNLESSFLFKAGRNIFSVTG
jgi:hypothetical protein